MEKVVNRSLVIKRQMLASACTVFHSWTTPFVAERWLFIDGSQHNEFKNQLTFQCVVPDELLSFTFSSPKHFDGESKITLNVRETAAGCEMSFVQEDDDHGLSEADWGIIFNRLDAVLQIPFRLTEESPVEDILTAIEIVIMQIFGLAGKLGSEQLNHEPGGGVWTIGQLLSHVEKYLHFIPDTLQMPGHDVERDPTAMAVIFRQTFLDPTISFQSPDMLVPEQKKYRYDELLRSVTSGLEKMRDLALSADLLQEIEGLPMGPVTKIELLLFTFYHSQRHLWQARKLIDALKK